MHDGWRDQRHRLWHRQLAYSCSQQSNDRPNPKRLPARSSSAKEGELCGCGFREGLKRPPGVLAGSCHHGSLPAVPAPQPATSRRRRMAFGRRRHERGSRTLKPVLAVLAVSSAMPPANARLPPCPRRSPSSRSSENASKQWRVEAAPCLGSWRDRRPCLIPFRAMGDWPKSRQPFRAFQIRLNSLDRRRISQSQGTS